MRDAIVSLIFPFFIVTLFCLTVYLLFYPTIQKNKEEKRANEEGKRYIQKYLNTDEKKKEFLWYGKYLADAKYPNPDADMEILYLKLKNVLDLFGLENLKNDNLIEPEDYIFLKEMLNIGKIPEWKEQNPNQKENKT